jgi:hypothetical protein
MNGAPIVLALTAALAAASAASRQGSRARAPLTIADLSCGAVHRCTPEEGLRLQGFNEQQIRLRSPRVRDRQTLVGNGWPASYGRWVAACVARTLGAP